MVVLAGSPACTVRVLSDAAAPVACGSDDVCPGGTACVEGACVEGESDPIPIDATLVGPDGGTVLGPDGLQLEIGAGALGNSTAFSMSLASATLEYANFIPTTRLYTITPSVTFSTGALVRLVVPAAASRTPGGQPQSLFLQPSPPGPEWTEVGDDDGDGSFVIAQTGTFGVGTAVTP
jgi:hypothetical protein